MASRHYDVIVTLRQTCWKQSRFIGSTELLSA